LHRRSDPNQALRGYRALLSAVQNRFNRMKGDWAIVDEKSGRQGGVVGRLQTHVPSRKNRDVYLRGYRHPESIQRAVTELPLLHSLRWPQRVVPRGGDLLSECG
jgi:hypothetical protein